MVRAHPAARVWLVQFSAPWYGFAGRAFGIALLNLITIGLYKPYGLTRTRTALYSNIYIGKDPLVYSGSASGLSRVTFYPSLAFLFLLLGPGVLQFMLSWQMAVGIGVLQFLLIAYYNRYLEYRNKQYEWDNLSWRGLSFTTTGEAHTYATTSFALGLLNWLTLGAGAPWRRIWALRYHYSHLFYGRLPVSCTLDPKPYLLRYYAGWVLALSGWCYLARYGWSEGVVPVRAILAGGTADPAMASAVDPALFAGGIPGGADSTTMAEVGTFMHALTLSFILLPAGLLWQKLCLAAYEIKLQRGLCASLSLAGSSLRFEGSLFGYGLLNTVTLLLNFIFANLTRPFTTYARLRYLARHTVVTAPEALENALKPPVPNS
jgi:uncharacterized membrane protein YjgN (DUF898 family)